MRQKVLTTIFKYSQVLMLLVIIIGFSLTTENFCTLDNFTTVVMQQLPFLLIISMAIITKGIDLSIGSILALSSCVGAYFLQKGQDLTGVLAALLIGLALGMMNGLLITKVHLIPFIATYSMNLVVRGLAYLFMGGLLYYGFSDRFRSLATGSFAGISNLLIISMVLFFALLFVLKRTVFGRNVYAMGFNRNATTLSGINTDRVLISIYTVNGLLAAVTGLLYISRLNAAESTIGNDFTLKMIAATLIGGTPFSGGKGGIEKTIVGVLIMMFLTNGMNLNRVSSLWQDAVFGAVIVLSLLINKLGEKMTGSQEL